MIGISGVSLDDIIEIVYLDDIRDYLKDEYSSNDEASIDLAKAINACIGYSTVEPVTYEYLRSLESNLPNDIMISIGNCVFDIEDKSYFFRPNKFDVSMVNAVPSEKYLDLVNLIEDLYMQKYYESCEDGYIDG